MLPKHGHSTIGIKKRVGLSASANENLEILFLKKEKVETSTPSTAEPPVEKSETAAADPESTVDVPKENVVVPVKTVKKAVQIDDGPKYYFQYHILRKDNGNYTIYELHVSCHIDNIDISKWIAATDEIECRIGFYYN